MIHLDWCFIASLSISARLSINNMKSTFISLPVSIWVICVRVTGRGSRVAFQLVSAIERITGWRFHWLDLPSPRMINQIYPFFHGLSPLQPPTNAICSKTLNGSIVVDTFWPVKGTQLISASLFSTYQDPSINHSEKCYGFLIMENCKSQWTTEYQFSVIVHHHRRLDIDFLVYISLCIFAHIHFLLIFSTYTYTHSKVNIGGCVSTDVTWCHYLCQYPGP